MGLVLWCHKLPEEDTMGAKNSVVAFMVFLFIVFRKQHNKRETNNHNQCKKKPPQQRRVSLDSSFIIHYGKMPNSAYEVPTLLIATT